MVEDQVSIKIVTKKPGVHLAEIEVSVDGQTKTFLLDTGAASSSIANDSHTENYPNLGESESKGASGIAKDCNLIQPNVMKFGRQEFQKPKLKRCDRNILGIDLIGHKTFQIDFLNKSLNYLKEFPNIGSSLPVRRLTPGHVIVPMLVSGLKIDVLFDTGADATVVDSKFVEEHPELFKLLRSEDGFDAHGNKIPSKVYVVNSVEIGQLRLTNVEMAAFDYGDFLRGKMEGAQMILGNNVISKAKWNFDLNSQKWFNLPYMD